MKPFIYNLDYVKRRSLLKLFKVVSTFAGFGGSSTGYRLAGGEVLCVNEFIPEAQRAYNRNYPDTPIFPQDIRELRGEDILKRVGLKIGELDVFDGSPPCSSFSMAGLREEGWGKTKKYSDSEQRTDDLFFEYIRILKELQPKTFIAENVKGLTLGEAFNILGNGQMNIWGTEEDTIYYKLVDAGYKVSYKVLNAADYGVPQARERIIFVGVRNDIPGDPVFPQPFGGFVSSSNSIKDIVLTHEEKIDLNKAGRELKFEELWKETDPGKSFSEACKRLYNKSGWFSQTKLHPDQPSCTITTHSEVISHWSECRLFSIKEISRFCSFPDDYFSGDDYLKQFERFGRAVPPLMMKAIAECLYENILKPLNQFNPIETSVNDFI